MRHFEAFKELLSTPKRIVITTHHKPDADALGSSLGLAAFLAKKHHQVHVITPTDYPKFLHWMHGNDGVIVFNEGNEEHSRKLVNDAEVIFCLDFSCLKRINELGEIVGEAGAIKVLIDHHENKEDFADFELWDIKAAATCELIYDLIVEMGEQYLIDKDIAEALYAGIMTDTGSFRHPNTTKNVHKVVANLIDIGADVAKVSKLIYDNNTVDRLRFIGYALSEKLVVLPEFKTAYFIITAEELKRFNSRTGDTEGLVNYALSIENITMAAVIIDRPDGIRLSFRSVGEFAVNDLAAKHFEGGGHKNAAGGASDVSLEETEQKFLKLLPLYKEQLHKHRLIPETQIEHEKVG